MSEIKFGSIGFSVGFLLGWLFFYLSGVPVERSPELAATLLLSLALGLAGVCFGLVALGYRNTHKRSTNRQATRNRARGGW